MVLLRRVIGDALRARRQGQQRTLREVSTAANVSLGYLSEIERGQKEASSELLAAICEALGAQLSELLREVSHTVAVAERVEDVLVPVGADRPAPGAAEPGAARAGGGSGEAPLSRRVARPVAQRRPVAPPTRAAGGEIRRPAAEGVRPIATEGTVSISVRQDAPLKATLRATRTVRSTPGRGRGVVYAA